jgi:tetratricopeptide (TPR) repeat protein
VCRLRALSFQVRYFRGPILSLAALNEVQTALQGDPTFLPALIWEGSVLADLGRYNEALVAYQKVLRVDSSLPDALNGYAWLIADQMPHPTTAQLQDARMRARQAIALRQDGNSYDTLGWICYKLGDYTCALEALQTAKGKQDPSASAWQDINYHLGLVYLRLNKRQEAKDALKEVIHYGSTFPTSQDKYVREAETQIASLK